MLFYCGLHSSCFMILTIWHMWGSPINYQKESIGHFLQHWTVFCDINRNCNSQRPTHAVDRQHSNQLLHVPDYQTHSIVPPICLNGHKNGHLYAPPPPHILAICGERTAFGLVWSIQTALSEYQAVSKVELSTTLPRCITMGIRSFLRGISFSVSFTLSFHFL